MKEKTKKVIKTLGVGALLCAGAFTFAGCSLNEEDKALVENKVAQLEQQLQDQKELLEDQKSLLEQQNNLINQQLLVDRAWGLIQTAQAKLLLNIDGVRDNLVIKDCTTDSTYQQVFYKTLGGDYLYYDTNVLVYEDSNGVYIYHPNYPSDMQNKKRELIYTNMEAYFADDGTIRLIFPELTKQSITNVEILNNGNYKIKLVYNRTEELEYISQPVSCIMELVISNDSKFISATQSIVQVQKWEGDGNDDEECHAFVNVDMKFEFKYGVVNVEEISALLGEAKAYKPE